MTASVTAAVAAVGLSAVAAPLAAAAPIPGLPGFGPQIVYDPSNLPKDAAQLAQQIAAVNAAKQQLACQPQALKELPNPRCGTSARRRPPAGA